MLLIPYLKKSVAHREVSQYFLPGSVCPRPCGIGVTAKGAPRLLNSGCPMAVPNWKLPMPIEASGAVIVGEESCMGERGAR